MDNFAFKSSPNKGPQTEYYKIDNHPHITAMATTKLTKAHVAQGRAMGYQNLGADFGTGPGHYYNFVNHQGKLHGPPFGPFKSKDDMFTHASEVLGGQRESKLN